MVQVAWLSGAGSFRILQYAGRKYLFSQGTRPDVNGTVRKREGATHGLEPTLAETQQKKNRGSRRASFTSRKQTVYGGFWATNRPVVKVVRLSKLAMRARASSMLSSRLRCLTVLSPSHLASCASGFVGCGDARMSDLSEFGDGPVCV